MLTCRQKCLGADAIKGAYSELFAGLDQSITIENNGCWGKSFSVIHDDP